MSNSSNNSETKKSGWAPARVLNILLGFVAIIAGVLALIGIPNYLEMKRAIGESIDEEISRQVTELKLPNMYDQSVIDALYIAVVRQKMMPDSSTSNITALRFRVQQELPRLLRLISDPQTPIESFSAAMNLLQFCSNKDVLALHGGTLLDLVQGKADDLRWIDSEPERRALLISFMADHNYRRAIETIRDLLVDSTTPHAVRLSAINFVRLLGDKTDLPVLEAIASSGFPLAPNARLALAGIDPLNPQLQGWIDSLEENPSPNAMQHGLDIAAELADGGGFGATSARVESAARILSCAVDSHYRFRLLASRAPNADKWDPKLYFITEAESRRQYFVPLSSLFGINEFAIAEVLHKRIKNSNMTGLSQALRCFGALPQDGEIMEIRLQIGESDLVRLVDGSSITTTNVSQPLILYASEDESDDSVYVTWMDSERTRQYGSVRRFESVADVQYAFARIVVEHTPLGVIRTRIVNPGTSRRQIPSGELIEVGVPRDPLDNREH